MKQTVEEAAKECRRTTAQSMGVYAQYHSIDECPNHGITYDEIAEAAFIKGAEWQSKQSPWISVKERLPKYNIEVIIYHEYRFYVGFMYYSMKSNWWRVNEDERTDMIVSEDDFWMPVPSFDDILEANKDVLERIKEKGD